MQVQPRHPVPAGPDRRRRAPAYPPERARRGRRAPPRRDHDPQRSRPGRLPTRSRPAAGAARKEKTTKGHDPLGAGDGRDPDREPVRPADLAAALAYLRSEAARIGLDEVCLHLDRALRALARHL